MPITRSKREIYLSIPNYLSYFRVITIPLIMILLGLQKPANDPHFHVGVAYASAILFVLTGITDLFDGYYARRMQLTSVFGKFLDPLADKLLHMAVMVMLIPLQELPAWLVVIFLFREITVTGLRGIAIAEGVVMGADYWGKKKTALLNSGLTCFLLPPTFLTMNSRLVGWVVVSLAFVVSIGSGINYMVGFFREVLHQQGRVKLGKDEEE
ncbi:MAG: CDP-diacylglycerol--glycerol-3-phosphate 3-phosphatidyltransferase [Deltaproteobacteria bacterium]|nr:CDP-diacylglycerol--glycerol-3-phosphate 3-phosphatidyltransferase [Deltaproteobacteria bacterium]